MRIESAGYFGQWDSFSLSLSLSSSTSMAGSVDGIPNAIKNY